MTDLSDAQVEAFIKDGFVRIDEAFPRRLAEEGRAILWRDTGCDPDDPATSGPFPCGFHRRMIPATPAGTSTPASGPKIRTS